MQALFFGPSSSPLAGAKHPAQGVVRDTALLICHAWGPEYMRSYRGTRQMAQRFAQWGHETLRFDYFGTGDSEGNALDASVDIWIDNIKTAATELRDSSGCTRVVLIGLRFGALIAAEALRRSPVADGLIAWDAPADGAAFVAAMQQQNRAELLLKNDARDRDRLLPPSDDTELLGHAWHRRLADAITALPPIAANDKALWWWHSQDHSVPPPPHAEPLVLPERSHWGDAAWSTTPWVPAASIAATEPVLRLLP